MQLIRNIVFLFCVGSMAGWCLELVYRRFFGKGRKWINPGFLVGPYLPLYGFGLDVLYVLASFEKYVYISNPVFKTILVVLAMTLMMTVLEYVTGVIFISKMKIKLWDYTECWGNLQGIICPRYSLYWGILSAVYYFLLHGHVVSLLNRITVSFPFTFFAGFYYGIFIIDFVYSAQLLAKIRKFADERDIIVKLEELKIHIAKKTAEKKKKAKFLFILSSNKSEPEHLLEFYNEMKAAKNAAIERIKNRKK